MTGILECRGNSLFRKDRQGKRGGGGVVLYNKNVYTCSEVENEAERQTNGKSLCKEKRGKIEVTSW